MPFRRCEVLELWEGQSPVFVSIVLLQILWHDISTSRDQPVDETMLERKDASIWRMHGCTAHLHNSGDCLL